MSPRHRCGWLPVCLLLAGVTLPALAAPATDTAPPTSAATQAISPSDWLLQRVRLGEARHDESLVDEALDKLDAIAPDAPEVLEARVRRALRNDERQRASDLVERLAEVAPDTRAYRMALLNLSLSRPDRRQALSRARLLAATGRIEQAKQAYDELLADGLPTLPLALEYWELVARLPDGESRAIQQLEKLDERYPQSPELGFTLARLLLDAGHDDAAFTRLESLARLPGTRQTSARMWLDALRGRPASAANVAAWQRLLASFSDTDYAGEARQILARQRQLLEDPGYQARQRGLARFEAQRGTSGEADIQRALTAYPDDIDLLGALGVIRLRQGRHAQALALFQRAQTNDTSGFSGDKWQVLIDTAHYWLDISRGDAALAGDHPQRAEQAYRRASRLQPGSPDAWLGLGDIARRRGDTLSAEQAYQRARRVSSDDGRALSRLAELYAKQSPQRALDFIASLPPVQQHALDDTSRQLRVAQLSAAGQRLAEAQQWSQAAERYAEARELSPADVWLTYSLAQALRQDGRRPQADASFADLLGRLDDPATRAQGQYAQALYLASDDRDDAALESLARIPDARRDTDMRALAARLERRQLLARASTLRASGDPVAARALLETQPADVDFSLQLGDWAVIDGDPYVAERHYEHALTQDPDNLQARLGLIEATLATGGEDRARSLLSHLELPPGAINERRRAANAWASLGEPSRAEALIADPATSEAATGDALYWRDAARIASANDAPAAALSRYRRGMVAGGLGNNESLVDDGDFTRAMRRHEGDDWLASSLRREAAALYQKRDTRIRAAHQVANDDGTDGVSSLTTTTDMLEVDTPFGAGRGFLRLDRVALDAGRLDRDADGLSRETFGTCAVVGCEVGGPQRDRGVSVALGWYDETWRMDIGTTPLGFAVEDWVGGLQYSGDAGPLWLTATLSRRPLDDSLLAFAGAEDPRSGTTWGGIRATGASLGLGYDQGGPNGVWSNFGVHHLAGERVPDNTRVQLMGGVYHKLINEEHRRLSVGLSTLMMHYSRELGGYSLGQGGYYSPQRYASLSLPVSYTQRTGDWSWQLDAAISQSWTDSDASARYPLGGDAIAGLPDATATRSGGSGGGFGFSLGGRVERRLADHWIAGLAVNLQQAEDYAPNGFNLSLRYTFGAWQGDLAMPPETLEPYADFD
ncbi:cellulose synthase complex outer membrane protein BcsC [Halomonas sp. HP20-15]|uniref:cellulose synthase complex outer membrane protein BcsC n=1 Tax=Halomonas sp. HP20-15 TaxID=3085901 RepID=UPI002980B70C|nr:cellulose synthase complex outer membrane protein BcsC [Halomonas sp. HP20-15]MDW5377130.1 cellulose synthase complex outer membrane protein BcsC [Halomonas sp. HP20-15]